MLITGIEQMLIGMYVLQTLSAAVSAMPKPTKTTGWYFFWYRFLHMQMNMLDEQFEKKFNVAMPRTIDESAIQHIETPDSVTDTTVSKTITTNPIQ